MDVADGLLEGDETRGDVRLQDLLVAICGGEVVVEEEVLCAGAQVELEPLGEEVVLIAEYSAEGEVELLALLVRHSGRAIDGLIVRDGHDWW